MGKGPEHNDYDDFAREAELYGIEERQPYSLQDRETPEQRDLSQRLIEKLYPHGLEEVDIEDTMAEFSHPQKYQIAIATNALMLSSFCTGQCGECGLCAEPYSENNRQIFALEPLIRFLEQYKMGGMGEIMLYDASDPLNYPYLLQLLDYLEQDDNYRTIKLLTSCPPGTEELLEEVLKRESAKVEFGLSILPSTQQRLDRSGAHAAVIADYRRRIEAAGPYQDVALRKKHREPKTIGRAHKKGYLAHGFSCGDETIITPHMGPCSGEYHIASDLYPTERKLTPVSESRRIYFHNKYFATQADDGFGMDHFPKLYTPNSSYVNIDTGEWAHDEVALRHLAAFIYYTLDNIMHRRTYNASMEDSLAKINEAIKSGKFVLPDDPEELGFYRKMILELLGKYTDPNMFQVSGFIEMGFSEIGSNSQRDYISLWSMIRTVLGRHAKFLFGEMETNTDESNGGR